MNSSVIKNLIVIFIFAMVSSICSFVSIFLAYSVMKFVLLGSGILGLIGCGCAFKKALSTFDE